MAFLVYRPVYILLSKSRGLGLRFSGPPSRLAAAGPRFSGLNNRAEIEEMWMWRGGATLSRGRGDIAAGCKRNSTEDVDTA